MALEEKARAAYLHGAEEHSRATLGRPLTPGRARAHPDPLPRDGLAVPSGPYPHLTMRAWQVLTPRDCSMEGASERLVVTNGVCWRPFAHTVRRYFDVPQRREPKPC